MIRIRWETDHGLLLLGYLVQRPRDGVHTSREVADWAHMPLPIVSKILKHLARAGILVSHRGVKGGYSLAHDPETITLAEVVQALEGPIGITECASKPGVCEMENGCPTRVNWMRISDAFRDSPSKIPLSDMYAPSVVTPELVTIGQGGAR